MKNKNYVQFLTDVDRLQVKFVEDRGKIARFSVHYCALIGKVWRPILRIDNFHHQNKPHRHSYYFKKKKCFHIGAAMPMKRSPKPKSILLKITKKSKRIIF